MSAIVKFLCKLYMGRRRILARASSSIQKLDTTVPIHAIVLTSGSHAILLQSTVSSFMRKLLFQGPTSVPCAHAGYTTDCQARAALALAHIHHGHRGDGVGVRCV